MRKKTEIALMVEFAGFTINECFDPVIKWVSTTYRHV